MNCLDLVWRLMTRLAQLLRIIAFGVAGRGLASHSGQTFVSTTGNCFWPRFFGISSICPYDIKYVKRPYNTIDITQQIEAKFLVKKKVKKRFNVIVTFVLMLIWPTDWLQWRILWAVLWVWSTDGTEICLIQKHLFRVGQKILVAIWCL